MKFHDTLGRAFIALVGILALFGCSKPPVDVPSGDQGWGVVEVPAGFNQVGFVGLPTDIDIPDYQFDLFQRNDQSDDYVGVFVAVLGPSCASGEVALKDDLPGLSACRNNTQIVVASRTHDLESVSSEVSVSATNTLEIPGFVVIAHQDHAAVPGIGSLPISYFATGSVSAYVMQDFDASSEDQQSIAVGSYIGARSDIAVLDWWFGYDGSLGLGRNEAEYSYPAFSAGDSEPVPTATLRIQQRGDWIVMVRTTDGAGISSRDVLEMVKVVPVDFLRDQGR